MTRIEVTPDRLRLFLDSADRAAWREWLPTGLAYGVTTNPTLLKRAGEPCTVDNLKSLAALAFDFGVREIQMQTWGGETDRLVSTGRALAAIDPRVVVKVPMDRNGIAAAARLIADGISVTMTAVYGAQQAITAAALGARYMAPYFGRMEEAGRDAAAELRNMQGILAAAGSGTRLLVASLRKVGDMTRIAASGAADFTISAELMAALITEPLTEQASTAFEEAAR